MYLRSEDGILASIEDFCEACLANEQANDKVFANCESIILRMISSPINIYTNTACQILSILLTHTDFEYH